MNLHQIYFSPTGTSRKIVAAVASGLAAETSASYDLTCQREPVEQTLAEGVAVIGFPVYAGRVPDVFLQRLSRFKAQNTPAVLVALYGNREYEDALVELSDVVSAAGFNVVAAAAFIGEHSYSTAEQPIAAGRPDRSDLDKAEAFGAQVAKKLAVEDLNRAPTLPGHRPYRDRPPLGGIAPESDPASCTLCGRCAHVCPTFVIDVGTEVVTRAEDCVMCCACVKDCPTGARKMAHPLIQERRTMLINNCSRRKEPELFL